MADFILRSPRRGPDGDGGVSGSDPVSDLGDPGADRLLGWDDSVGAVVYYILGTNISITNDTINVAGTSDPLTGLGDPGQDRIAGWDDSIGAVAYFKLGANITIDNDTINVVAPATPTDPITALGDPNADRIAGWDDSAGGIRYFKPGTNVTIDGDTINVTVPGNTVFMNAFSYGIVDSEVVHRSRTGALASGATTITGGFVTGDVGKSMNIYNPVNGHVALATISAVTTGNATITPALRGFQNHIGGSVVSDYGTAQDLVYGFNRQAQVDTLTAAVHTETALGRKCYVKFPASCGHVLVMGVGVYISRWHYCTLDIDCTIEQIRHATGVLCNAYWFQDYAYVPSYGDHAPHYNSVRGMSSGTEGIYEQPRLALTGRAIAGTRIVTLAAAVGVGYGGVISLQAEDVVVICYGNVAHSGTDATPVAEFNIVDSISGTTVYLKWPLIRDYHDMGDYLWDNPIPYGICVIGSTDNTRDNFIPIASAASMVANACWPEAARRKACWVRGLSIIGRGMLRHDTFRPLQSANVIDFYLAPTLTLQGAGGMGIKGRFFEIHPNIVDTRQALLSNFRPFTFACDTATSNGVITIRATGQGAPVVHIHENSKNLIFPHIRLHHNGQTDASSTEPAISVRGTADNILFENIEVHNSQAGTCLDIDSSDVYPSWGGENIEIRRMTVVGNVKGMLITHNNDPSVATESGLGPPIVVGTINRSQVVTTNNAAIVAPVFTNIVKYPANFVEASSGNVLGVLYWDIPKYRLTTLTCLLDIPKEIDANAAMFEFEIECVDLTAGVVNDVGVPMKLGHMCGYAGENIGTTFIQFRPHARHHCKFRPNGHPCRVKRVRYPALLEGARRISFKVDFWRNSGPQFDSAQSAIRIWRPAITMGRANAINHWSIAQLNDSDQPPNRPSDTLGYFMSGRKRLGAAAHSREYNIDLAARPDVLSLAGVASPQRNIWYDPWNVGPAIAVYPGINLRNANTRWTRMDVASPEYMCEFVSGGRPPRLARSPARVTRAGFPDVVMTSGTLGTLAEDQWAYTTGARRIPLSGAVGTINLYETITQLVSGATGRIVAREPTSTGVAPTSLTVVLLTGVFNNTNNFTFSGGGTANLNGAVTSFSTVYVRLPLDASPNNLADGGIGFFPNSGNNSYYSHDKVRWVPYNSGVTTEYLCEAYGGGMPQDNSNKPASIWLSNNTQLTEAALPLASNETWAWTTNNLRLTVSGGNVAGWIPGQVVRMPPAPAALVASGRIAAHDGTILTLVEVSGTFVPGTDNIENGINTGNVVSAPAMFVAPVVRLATGWPGWSTIAEEPYWLVGGA